MTTYDTFARGVSPFPGIVRVYAGTGSTTESNGAGYDFDSSGVLVQAGRRVDLGVMNAIRKVAGFAPIALWQMEHPTHAADHMPTIPAGFEDSSWCNDMCPSFTSEALGLVIWVDHSERDKREFPEIERFCVQSTDDEGAAKHGPELRTDDWSEVLAFVAKAEGKDPEAARAAYLEKLATDAADAAANAMALAIQLGIGDDSGDIAGLFFSGPDESRLQDMARRLIATERNLMGGA